MSVVCGNDIDEYKYDGSNWSDSEAVNGIDDVPYTYPYGVLAHSSDDTSYSVAYKLDNKVYVNTYRGGWGTATEVQRFTISVKTRMRYIITRCLMMGVL